MQYQSESIELLITALSKAQGEITPAIKDSTNPHFKSKYADLTSVWNACRAPLSKNGLAVVQTMDNENGQFCLFTTLAHISGQWMRSKCPLIMQKQDAQGFGSALSYFKRYALAAMVGVVSDDDDGNAACAPAPAPKQEIAKPISESQYHVLNDMIGEDYIYRDNFMKYIKNRFGINSIELLPSEIYEMALQGARVNNEKKAKLANEQVQHAV